MLKHLVVQYTRRYTWRCILQALCIATVAAVTVQQAYDQLGQQRLICSCCMQIGHHMMSIYVVSCKAGDIAKLAI